MPIIQLDFNNPLNTSVQVGDMVYFTNPSQVPGTIQHVHGDPNQPPPHETSTQENIILIGKIIPNGIIPFDGVKSSIQCDMDQVLFNKYSNNIIAGGCGYTPSLSSATGQMATMVRIADTPPLDTDNYHACPTCQTSTAPYVNPQTDYANPLVTLFSDNPSWYPYETAVRLVKNTNPVYASESAYAAAGYAVADPNDPYYQPGRINTFGRMAYFVTTDDGITYGYPTSLNWNQLMANHPNAISQAPGPLQGITGSISPGVVNCNPGSFIMFSKDNKVNQLDVLGYYAAIEYKNNSTEEAELFNIGATYFDSSK